ncbi:MAG: hypothetical protein ACRDLE_10305 [Gaiellaceae bacterium]
MGILRAAVLVAIALAIVAGVGRWERNSEVAAQIKGMRNVRALVGPLDQHALTGYRVQPGFDCLVYRRGSDPFALELCAQRSGRMVEAIDRRSTQRRIYSLRSEPSASTVYIDGAEFNRLLDRMTHQAG